MGVFITLSVLRDKISDSQWSGFYKEVHNFLKAYPLKLVSLDVQTVQTKRGTFQRYQYTRNFEKGAKYLQVVGSLEKMEFGETFCIPAHLPKSTRSKSSEDTFEDLLSDNGYTVFSNKTQGRPYHFAILGIGILAETRFPGRALVTGDITAREARYSLGILKDTLGVDAKIPFVTDAKALFDYYCAHYKPEEALERALRVFRSEQSALLTDFFPFVDKEVFTQRFIALLKEQTPGSIGVTQFFIRWLNATKDVETLLHICCDADAIMSFEDFAKTLGWTGIGLDSECQEKLRLLRGQSSDCTPMTVERQFSDAYSLMSGFFAMDINFFLPEDAIFEILKCYCPEKFPDAVKLFREKTQIQKAKLLKIDELSPASDDGESREPIPLDVTENAYVCNTKNSCENSPIQSCDDDDGMDDFFAIVAEAYAVVLDDFIASCANACPIQKKNRTEKEDRLVRTYLRETIRIYASENKLVLPEERWKQIDAETDIWYLIFYAALVRPEVTSGICETLRMSFLRDKDLCARLRPLLPKHLR